MTSRAATGNRSGGRVQASATSGRAVRPAVLLVQPPRSTLEQIEFTVDSALLQELGERLVGRAHIALAELIKNSFDADARLVVLTVTPDEIVVADNGHGMADQDFRKFWMRIGSPHKDERRSSPAGRRMTGSKGVGRLSAQFLANKIEMTTRAQGHRALYAEVNWREAVRARELTKAKALWTHVRTPQFADGSETGTTIRLSELKQEWDSAALRELAQELWPLQPPYAVADRSDEAFRVELETPDPEAERTFGQQMRAVLELWSARITGSIRRSGRSGKLHVRIQFRDDEVLSFESSISGARIEEADFEIRVFDLKRRQPYGIRVEEARSYLNRFGGVHVYDAGFHLPYFGPDVDWLGIEQDHSHRLSRSELLPEELQLPGGLSFLPTNSRLYGVVQIDTSAERRAARAKDGDAAEPLSIQISRDRLIDNRAYRQLQKAVRWAIDAYAMQEARRRWEEVDEESGDEAPLKERALRVEEVLDRYASEISPPVLQDIRGAIAEVTERAESEAERNARQAGLLGALATAGISAIALEHESARYTAELRRLARRIHGRARELNDPELDELATRLTHWTETVQSTRRLFAPFMDQKSREEVRRLLARRVLERTVEQSQILMRGVRVETDEVPHDLRLPPGRFAEWTAIFQNLLVNAANATLDAEKRLIAVSGGGTSATGEILIQDTGSGVDLRRTEELFTPFTRRQQISRERRALGAGGTGLGLTIVRMIARNLSCLVDFVEPDESFATAVRVYWRSV